MNRLLALSLISILLGCSASAPPDKAPTLSGQEYLRQQQQRIEVLRAPTAPKAAKEAPRPTAAPMPAPAAPITTAKVDKKINKPQAGDVLEQLTLSNMVFSVPEQANIQDDIPVELLIDSVTVLNELEQKLKVKGQVIKSQILTSKIVTATLIAPDFDIQFITSQRQALSHQEPTQWVWILTPKRAGVHDIHLSITANVIVDNEHAERHLKTFDRILKIEITRKQFMQAWFKENWQWFLGLLIPFGVWLWKRYFGSKEKE